MLGWWQETCIGLADFRINVTAEWLTPAMVRRCVVACSRAKECQAEPHVQVTDVRKAVAHNLQIKTNHVQLRPIINNRNQFWSRSVARKFIRLQHGKI